MSTLEENINASEVKSAKISLRREMVRRAELQAIRRDILALAQEQQKIQKKMLALSQRVYNLITE